MERVACRLGTTRLLDIVMKGEFLMLKSHSKEIKIYMNVSIRFLTTPPSSVIYRTMQRKRPRRKGTSASSKGKRETHQDHCLGNKVQQ